MTAPTCSIVMPAYNAAPWIDSAIRSALLQTLTDLEVIVVDDGSTDATAEHATAWTAMDSRVRLIRQSNLGLPAARNAGIALAGGRFVTFLDSDDLLAPKYLAKMVAALEAAPGAGLAYTDAWLFDDVTKRVRRATSAAYHPAGAHPPEAHDAFFEALVQGNFVYGETTVPRSVLHQVGGFREDLTSLEDYELWLRILANGLTAVRVVGPLAIYRRSPGQMSANRRRMAENLKIVLTTVLAWEQTPPGAFAAASRRLQKVTAELDRDDRAVGRLVTRAWERVRAAHAQRTPGIWLDEPPLQVVEAFGDVRAL